MPVGEIHPGIRVERDVGVGGGARRPMGASAARSAASSAGSPPASPTTRAPTSWTRCCDAQRHRHRHRLLGDDAHGAPHRRHRDDAAAPRDHRRARAHRAHPRRRRLHVRRELRLHLGRDVLVRQQPRRHRRVAAQARLARRDGRRVGDVRSVAPPAPRRHRDRGGHRFGSFVDRRSRARSTRWRWTRTTSRRSASIR